MASLGNIARNAYEDVPQLIGGLEGLAKQVVNKPSSIVDLPPQLIEGMTEAYKPSNLGNTLYNDPLLSALDLGGVGALAYKASPNIRGAVQALRPNLQAKVYDPAVNALDAPVRNAVGTPNTPFVKEWEHLPEYSNYVSEYAQPQLIARNTPERFNDVLSDDPIFLEEGSSGTFYGAMPEGSPDLAQAYASGQAPPAQMDVIEGWTSPTHGRIPRQRALADGNHRMYSALHQTPDANVAMFVPHLKDWLHNFKRGGWRSHLQQGIDEATPQMYGGPVPKPGKIPRDNPYPPSPGHVRLYRGGQTGNSFTPSRELAEVFAAQYGDELHYIDLPEDVAAGYYAQELTYGPASGRASGAEYRLPDEIAQTKQPLTNPAYVAARQRLQELMEKPLLERTGPEQREISRLIKQGAPVPDAYRTMTEMARNYLAGKARDPKTLLQGAVAIYGMDAIHDLMTGEADADDILGALAAAAVIPMSRRGPQALTDELAAAREARLGTTGVIPEDLSNFEKVRDFSYNDIQGVTSGKALWRDPDTGAQYFTKPNQGALGAARAEVASVVHDIANPGSTPPVAYVAPDELPIKAVTGGGSIQPFMPDADNLGAGRPSVEQVNQILEAAPAHYLLNNTDVGNTGNWMMRGDESMIPIDMDFALRPTADRGYMRQPPGASESSLIGVAPELLPNRWLQHLDEAAMQGVDPNRMMAAAERLMAIDPQMLQEFIVRKIHQDIPYQYRSMLHNPKFSSVGPDALAEAMARDTVEQLPYLPDTMHKIFRNHGDPHLQARVRDELGASNPQTILAGLAAGLALGYTFQELFGE